MCNVAKGRFQARENTEDTNNTMGDEFMTYTNVLTQLKEQMRVKEQAMNTALIAAESNGKSDYELFEIQMLFENELVELQNKINKVNSNISKGKVNTLAELLH